MSGKEEKLIDFPDEIVKIVNKMEGGQASATTKEEDARRLALALGEFGNYVRRTTFCIQSAYPVI